MKGDSSMKHGQELKSSRLKVVGKGECLALDDASHATGCVDKTLNHGLSFFEAAFKAPFASMLNVSRLSQDCSAEASQIKFKGRQPMVLMNPPLEQRDIPQEDDKLIERNDSYATGEEVEEVDHVEEGTLLTYKTEDEVQQIVDFIVDHLVSFLGLPNEFKSTTWSACHTCLPDDHEPVTTMPQASTSEGRELLSSSRSTTRDQTSREKPEDILPEETDSEVAVQDADVMSENPTEYDLETFSRHSLMADKSKSTEPDHVKIAHRGKEMMIDRRAFEAIMDFVAYPEKYLQLNPPKTYTRELLASLKRRRGHTTNKATPDHTSAETTTDATFSNVSDMRPNLNEGSRSKSGGINFEKVMDFIAFPEKHCIPKLKASLLGKYTESTTTGPTEVNQVGPREPPSAYTTKSERILADFLDQHCNIYKDYPRHNFITGEDQVGDHSLNELRRDRSLISQCSTTTDDSSRTSVTSTRNGRFFGSGGAINVGRGSSKPQRNKNAVERYLSVATKK